MNIDGPIALFVSGIGGGGGGAKGDTGGSGGGGGSGEYKSNVLISANAIGNFSVNVGKGGEQNTYGGDTTVTYNSILLEFRGGKQGTQPSGGNGGSWALGGVNPGQDGSANLYSGGGGAGGGGSISEGGDGAIRVGTNVIPAKGGVAKGGGGGGGGGIGGGGGAGAAGGDPASEGGGYPALHQKVVMLVLIVVVVVVVVVIFFPLEEKVEVVT